MPRRQYIGPLSALLEVSVPELMLGRSVETQPAEPLDRLIGRIRSRVERCRIIARRLDPDAAASLIRVADEGDADIAALIASRKLGAAA